MAVNEHAIIESLSENAHLFVYFSDLLGRSVVDAAGAHVGKLADFKVALGELFPKIASVAVRRRRRKGLWELDWAQMQGLNDRAVVLKDGAIDAFRPLEVRGDEI